MASGVISQSGDRFPQGDIRKPPAAANEGDEGTEQQLPKIRPRGRNHGDQTWPSRKAINGIKQGQCQISSADDEITQSLETVSEEYEWPQSKNSLLLIEKLRMDCKDSVSLLKIQDAVLAYERLIEFKKSHCRLLRRKTKHMENKVCRLHKKLSELREVKSQLEHQTVEWEQKCCSLRFTLKKEKEKRRNANILCEKIREELKRKEKQYSKEVEEKGELELTLRAREMELKILRSNLNQVQEAQNCNAVQETMKRQDYLENLESENLQLKLTIKEQSDKIKEIQQNLLSSSSTDDLRKKLDTVSSDFEHLYTMNEALQQQLISLKTIEKKYKKLKEEKNQLKQIVANLRSHIEMNMTEHGQIVLYKQEVEEKARQYIVDRLKEVNLFLQAQSASQENINQLRENNDSTVRSHMELKINDLEFELSKMKTAHDSKITELEKYKLFYQEELEAKKSLSSELNDTKKRLAAVSKELHTEKRVNRSLLSALTVRSVQAVPCCGNPKNNLVLNRDLVVKENLLIPVLRAQPSNNSMDDYLTKIHQELDEYITRELQKQNGMLPKFDK
ncbi:ankyrin repeat domain-containing protein 26-like isoform X1 [Ochotona princeps]|uniref:ankyrin repeat domain-containing protein 26-like isoform X1 n=2 Tax=Ochotona princeps TaxID=9978 RepID=UPI002714C622|nr:ankyrin repeat domain-containing protein 26-like isoform X1 [Ochotona princeps]